MGVGLETGVGVAANVGVGDGVWLVWDGTGEDGVNICSGICELSKNIRDSIILIAA